MALPIWAYYMQKVFADKSLGYDPNEKFDLPEGYNGCNTAKTNTGYGIEDVFE
jgi:penicillin-binding protein 1A